MEKVSFPKRVGIWIRVSTEQQAQSDSPEHHECRAREYAQSRGWHVAEVYRLAGVSGAVSLDHAEAKRMLADVENGRIEALIASKFARIARDGVQFRLLYRRFKEAKATLISLDESIDTSTPAGELILGLIADLAEWERKEIASRVRASVRPRAQAGKPLGGVPPYGYQWKDRKLVPQPDEAPIRRLIHELYVEHRRKRVVAEILNERGYRTRKGALWSEQTIDWLLCDPSAKGQHRKNYLQSNGPNTRWSCKPESEIVYSPVEAIVSPDVWDQANAILMDAKRAHSRPAKRSDHLFTGIVYCECGRRMYGREHWGRYACNSKGGCGSRVERATLESVVGTVLTDRMADAAWASGYVAQAQSLLGEKQARLRELDAEQTISHQTIRKAFELVVQGQMPESRYQLICEPHETGLAARREESARLRSEIEVLSSPDVTPAAIRDETAALAKRWSEAEGLGRRACLEAMEFRLTVTQQNGIKVELQYFPFSEKLSNYPRTLSGPGSTLNSPSGFFVGADGNANRMVISGGGQAVAVAGSAGSFIGRSVGTRSNVVMVSGPDSRWSINDSLFVGAGGHANLLVVSNGATVGDLQGTVGNATSGSNNVAIVTGGSSIWSNRFDLYVGAGGNSNRLVVSDGGSMFNDNAFVGLNSSTRGNSVLMAGAGTLWDNRSTLRLGFDGSGNEISVSNRATLLSSNGIIGSTANAGFNHALVSGAGTLWNNRHELKVGDDGFNNQLTVADGGRVISSNGFVGFGLNSRSNLASVTGSGSVWSNYAGFTLGRQGPGNQVIIRDGGDLETRGFIQVGEQASSSNNTVIVAGAGSRWDSLFNGIFLGSGGGGNRLFITNGGIVLSGQSSLGLLASSVNNEVLVTDPGSRWIHSSITVGRSGSANRLIIRNGGNVFGNFHVNIGENPVSTNNRVLVDGGTLTVTNAAGVGMLEVLRGTNVLNAGLIDADILRMTNGTLSKFEFNGGTLSVRSSRISIGPPLVIGNGSNAATFILAGNGTHDMSGTLGLIVTNNATLTGNGSLLVQLQVRPGATLSPGASIGKISVNSAPALQGATLMEISKNGATLTNDQFLVTGTLTYGGTLTVTNLGPTAFVAGDTFPLFSATAYAGAFTMITLPPLAPPLFWKNNLLVNGSLEVAAPPAISLSAGPHTQNFDSLATNGGANPWRDNVTLLGWYAGKSVAPTNITTYRASDGGDNAGALYSFGATGSGERALGSIGSGSVGFISYGLCFTNDTGASVGNFVVSYTGEQWRDSSSFNTNTLTFWYRVSAIAPTNPEPGNVTDWTAHTGLDFASPTVTGAGVGLNGNAPANRRVFTSVPVSGLTVPPGHSVFFRWQDPDDPGTDEGVAVDDLTVTFVPLARDFGVDVSHFQNESGVPQSSWDQMFAEGKRFVFIKATEGLTGPHDPTMSNNVGRATAAGLLAGVYHFAHPENRPTPAGAVLEASNMVVYAGSAIGPGRLRPVLDLERGANLTTAELTDWVIAFSDEIIARRGPGAAPIIYCSQTFANNELDSRLANYDLWLRTVGSGADPAVDDPPGVGFADATGVFNNWSFWQYSSTGSAGGLTPLDLNVCHSEFKPLSSFLIPEVTPTPIQLTGMTASLNGAFEISFTNTPGAQFTVLSATNVTLPASNWTVLGTVPEISPGQFQFTDTNAPAFPVRFYRVMFP